MKSITAYQDINKILLSTLERIQAILDKNLIGLYLFGSLTYGDFNPNSSDIDLVAIINEQLNQHKLNLLKQLHQQLQECDPKWGDRMECSYTPIALFENILPPKEPRPYYGCGVFYDEAPYGNEWIINNYLLFQHGIALIGPDFKTLIQPIEMLEVQKACIRDLFQEWEPKITDIEWLSNSHYQSYLVLNLCRILYTVLCGLAGTKKEAADWVKKELGTHWHNLIETAENWQYGRTMSLRNEAVDFIKFTVDKIKQTKIYQKNFINK